MKKLFILAATVGLASGLGISPGALASDKEEKPAPSAKPGETPAMSEIPTMKAQGERMATLMEQLSKESDPEARRRIMAEAVCPQ